MEDGVVGRRRGGGGAEGTAGSCAAPRAPARHGDGPAVGSRRIGPTGVGDGGWVGFSGVIRAADLRIRVREREIVER